MLGDKTYYTPRTPHAQCTTEVAMQEEVFRLYWWCCQQGRLPSPLGEGVTLHSLPCNNTRPLAQPAPELICRLPPAWHSARLSLRAPHRARSQSLPHCSPEGQMGTKVALAGAAFCWGLSQGMEKDAPMLHKLNKSVVTGSYSGACVKGQWLILGPMNCLGALPRACRLWLQCTDARCKVKLHRLLSSSHQHHNLNLLSR